ncbi:MAG: Dihydromethanopterin reductase (acceptor) [ANME-2 cluster archaeon]|nr:Dihydromethanopterin reductase (acceptor) [ANME-2 cluster archaeon]
MVRSELPYNIDRDLCQNCEDCPPTNECSKQAFTDEPQIDLLLCDGCGNCVDICTHSAIKGGEVELEIRDIDSRNVRILRELDEITVLDDPYAILEII